MKNIAHWISAFRLRTLPLALSCILMAGFIASRLHSFNWSVFSLTCLTIIFLQVLSNIANDYGDSIHGADGEHRKGPKRAVSEGNISKNAMKKAIIALSTLSLISGILLLKVSVGINNEAFLYMLALGVLCIIGAITYTMGKKPYGYAGLGDLSVLFFFGFVGVIGSLFLFTHEVELAYILPALSLGLFSTAVLNVNNVRDIESDKIANKLSLPVRIGREKAVIYHWFLLGGGIISAIIFTLTNYHSSFQWLFLLSVPLFVKNGLAVQKYKEPQKLDPFLKQMALSTLLFVILFGIGYIL
ncbi:1,4-dihydroxy-2-naphthoate polyprenyltransferase [Aureibacter tunicatorum]|uniref:1,4-dihydroxy-2-naphthoate octaprenyltransferase n=1 Tax=Aureibacter tunicatorum TaxID=866807 RepID=A0AAE3XSR4_9BACT|nr:1,4-dihydroxy-2-naphthoate polyprenyltransferase [Aureibacter tunicatorum]MDR6240904.1 1,4-dihydroxy-2-naphthoate octaprenyltransferase [Aureibacter tunicatorum]BDD03684.1 1,4-dihydroxy-2-naphthoate octaprenyltransferase [Aureibacter tunicatorum]